MPYFILGAAFTITVLSRIALRRCWLRPAFRYLRGTKFIRMNLQQEDSNHRYLWGNQFLSFEQARKHFLVVGSTGSGKTLNILLLLKTVLKQVATLGTGARALLYDSKTDMLSHIAGIGFPEEKIRVLNPFDARCTAWDMARDITDSAMADDVASVLIPVDKDAKDPYFSRTAQRFLSGVIEAFIEHAEHWTLRDLILAVQNRDRLRPIFESTAETEGLTQHFKPENTFHNVHSTLDGILRGYRAIAASWEAAFHEGHSLSVEDWLSSQELLILGNSPRAKSAISRVNQLLFTQIAKSILDRPGRSTQENWIFLDEFRELGKLDNISDLMITGRSKGAAIVLGFQDISGVEDIYGEHLGREIVGCTQNIAIVHINSSQPHTQDWASRILGDTTFLLEQTSESTSSAPSGKTTGQSTQYNRVTEKCWLPSQFAVELPPASSENGLQGLFKSVGSFYKQRIPPDVLFGPRGTTNRIPAAVADYPNRIDVSSDRLILKDWDETDVKRLGIPALEHFLVKKPSRSTTSQAPVSKSLADYGRQA